MQANSLEGLKQISNAEGCLFLVCDRRCVIWLIDKLIYCLD